MLWLPAILILPYIFVLLKIYRSLLIIKPFSAVTDPSIFVSVVVACYNEQENLPMLLKSISDQNYPQELFEVIIVNDNSTDKTFDAATGFNGIKNIIAINNRGTGKKKAIRTGIEASKGKLIITTDADCQMGERWLSAITSFYEQHKPDMIICPVQIESKSGFFGRFQELEFLSLQGITAGTTQGDVPTMCNGANLSFTREAYLNNSEKLHHEIYSGDDVFLLHSLKMNNSNILWLESPDAMVTTSLSSTISSFLKQRRRWISKGKAYTDGFTILIGIVTFITILTQVSVLVAGIFYPKFLWVFLAIFLLKSVPDFLILRNTAKRYVKSELMNWFIPSQILYPFYVLSVVCYSLISNPKRGH
jgi:glycosyltransferase involved in cell wall biosynthesis